MRGDVEEFVLSSFETEAGVTVFGVIKSRRLNVKAVFDGKRVALPPLDFDDAEKMGLMQAKFLNWLRDADRGEALLRACGFDAHKILSTQKRGSKR